MQAAAWDLPPHSPSFVDQNRDRQLFNDIHHVKQQYAQLERDLHNTEVVKQVDYLLEKVICKLYQDFINIEKSYNRI